MGTTFDSYLARPSTIRLLRSIIHDDWKQTRKCGRQRYAQARNIVYANCVVPQINEGHQVHNEETATTVKLRRIQSDPSSVQSSETAELRSPYHHIQHATKTRAGKQISSDALEKFVPLTDTQKAGYNLDTSKTSGRAEAAPSLLSLFHHRKPDAVKHIRISSTVEQNVTSEETDSSTTRSEAKDHGPETRTRVRSAKTAKTDHVNRYHIRNEPILTRPVLNTIIGDAHGIKEKPISDSFCAKVFATRLITFQMALSALQLLGVENIGNLALQEIARQSRSMQDLSERLEHLHREGLNIIPSVYSRLVQDIAHREDHGNLQALLGSEQHPDNFEDTNLQRQLLEQFQAKQKWLQVHLTLQALSVAGHDPKKYAWVMLLQARISNGDWNAVQQYLDIMAINKIPLPLHILVLITRRLALRDPGKRSQHARDPIALLDLVAKAYMQATEQATLEMHDMWIEVIKRYGMEHRYDRVERVVMWLAENWQRSNADGAVNQALLEMLQKVLSVSMQRAVVHWSWRDASLKGQLRIMKEPATSSDVAPWARGLVMLKQLRRMGIAVQAIWARKAVKQQLWIIFGPYMSMRVMNIDLCKDNRLTLAQYVQQAEAVWPGLMQVPEELLTSNDRHAELLVAVFGEERSINKHEKQSADVKEWSKTQHHLSGTVGYRLNSDQLDELRRHDYLVRSNTQQSINSDA